MKITIVSCSDTQGGAARASKRLYHALNERDIDCEMLVKNKLSDEYKIISPSSIISRSFDFITFFLSKLINKLQKTTNVNLHSSNLFGSSVFKLIQKSDANIINLHWINFETLSIKQISKINKPIVMTLHDMWAFCGSEHLSSDIDRSAFRLGYDGVQSEHDYISGLEINKSVWERKCKYWKIPFTIVAPSEWLANCARESVLFKNWDIHVIPNPINTNVYKPIDKFLAREILNLPRDKKIIGFGAVGGGEDPNKGFDLLKDALNNIAVKNNVHCVVFGQSTPKEPLELDIPVQFIGYINDDITLALFYNAIDVMVVPSRQENLPQTATEAQSCGTPVVAFNCTGLVDAVEHKVTGYLAEPFESSDLAYGIEWVIDNPELIDFSSNGRARALCYWDQKIVAKQYSELYKLVLDS